MKKTIKTLLAAKGLSVTPEGSTLQVRAAPQDVQEILELGIPSAKVLGNAIVLPGACITLTELRPRVTALRYQSVPSLTHAQMSSLSNVLQTWMAEHGYATQLHISKSHLTITLK